MSQSSNGLHLNCVPLIQRSVQNSWRINALNSDIFEVGVTHIKVLGGERHRTDLHIGSGQFVDQTRFTDIRETKEQNGRQVGIDRRQSSNMLSDLFQIGQTWPDSFDRGTHSSKGSNLKLLASVERV